MHRIFKQPASLVIEILDVICIILKLIKRTSDIIQEFM